MRTRDEIESGIEHPMGGIYGFDVAQIKNGRLTLEVLLDIRDLLSANAKP